MGGKERRMRISRRHHWSMDWELTGSRYTFDVRSLNIIAAADQTDRSTDLHSYTSSALLIIFTLRSPSDIGSTLN